MNSNKEKSIMYDILPKHRSFVHRNFSKNKETVMKCELGLGGRY